MIAEVGYALEPSTVIAALAKINITTVESVLRAFPLSFSSTNSLGWIWYFFSQLPKEAFADLKETFNSADNVNIAPIHVVEEVSVG